VSGVVGRKGAGIDLAPASWQNGPTAGTTANRTRIGQSGARTAVLSTAGKVHGR